MNGLLVLSSSRIGDGRIGVYVHVYLRRTLPLRHWKDDHDPQSERARAPRRARLHRCSALVSLVGISTVHSGSAQAYPDPSPTGHLDALELTPNGLHVAGWARDPNTTAAI